MKKRYFALGLALISVGILLGSFVTLEVEKVLNLRGNVGVDLSVETETSTPFEIHAQITIFRDRDVLFSEYHAGAVTNLGDNMTLFKLFGSTNYRYGAISYLENATFISIGNKGTLSTSSVVLPGEWNRTAGSLEVIGQSQINITATFYPSTGPYTADCIGLNFDGTASGNDLWGYDEFTEVTGIDDTFTINVEFSVTVSHV